MGRIPKTWDGISWDEEDDDDEDDNTALPEVELAAAKLVELDGFRLEAMAREIADFLLPLLDAVVRFVRVWTSHSC